MDKVLDTAITSCKTKLFSEQSLFTMLEQDDKIKAYLTFERHFGGQIYMVQDLKNSWHCTLPTIDIKNVHDTIRATIEGCTLPFLHVPKSTNYVSKHNEIVVINSDEDVPVFTEATHKNGMSHPIKKLTSMVHQLFRAGVADYFDYDNKKRSSQEQTDSKESEKTTTRPTKRGKRKRGSKAVQSKKSSEEAQKHVLQSKHQGCSQRAVTVDPKALPVISLGWTTQDCNQYGSNLVTVAGNVKPFLRDANLPSKAKCIVANIVEAVLKFLPGKWAFNIEEGEDDDAVCIRLKMAADFKENLSGDRDVEHFRVEGITILIPLSIGLHKDTLNCESQGMQSVISINCQVPMNEETIPDGKGSKLWVWLNKNGYTESFPCSIILYSRKHVYYICKKLAESKRFAEKDVLRKCVNWAFLNRVGSVTDYRSRIWNNESFPNLFKRYSKTYKTSRFKGAIWTSPACYDKTVSTMMFVLLLYC